MLSFLHKYAKDYIFSQNGEEGVLQECIHRLNLRYGLAVEIGGNDGVFCSNIAYLLTHGWGGVFVEQDFDLYEESINNWTRRLIRESHDDSHLLRPVRHQCSRVTPSNVNAFVDHRCDVLSLDTDGSDYEIFKALNAKPKIVIIEIDSSYPPHVLAFNSDGAGTYRNTVELGISKGYFLLCHTGNLVFAANEYRESFPEIEGDGLSNAELYFNRAWLKAEVAA